MGSSADWGPINLAPERCCFAVDLPGHGKSTGMVRTAYEFSTVSHLLKDSLEAEGITDLDLVGYSMGGRIALDFTKRYPDQVCHLILEASLPGLASDEDRLHRIATDKEQSTRLRSEPESFIRQWLEADIFVSLKSKPDIVEKLLGERAEHDAREWAQALEGFSPARQPDFYPWLIETRKSVACITGQRDRKYSAIWKRIHIENDRIRHMIIHGASHNVHLEQPEMYLEALRSILTD